MCFLLTDWYKRSLFVFFFILSIALISTPDSVAKSETFKGESGLIIHREYLQHKDANKKIELYWTKSKGDEPRPAILFIHGHQKKRSLGGKEYVKFGALSNNAKFWGWVAAAISQPGYGKSDGPPDFCGFFTQETVLEAIEFLRQKPFVNPDKIILYGVSRGAIVASMIATKDSRLSAVILLSGIYDLVNEYPTGFDGLDRAIEKESGTSHDSLKARSAIYYTQKIRAPILLLHGEYDDRCYPNQAKAFAQKLAASDVPVRIKIFPNVGHNIPFKQSSMEVTPFLSKYVGFHYADIEKYLKHRNYTKFLEDKSGNKVMEITIQYLGKKPRLPLTINIPWNWKTKDTDWYNVIFNNISEDPIKFNKLTITDERGVFRKPKEVSKKQIKQRLNTIVLAPGEQVARRNTAVTSWVPNNLFHMIYSIKHNKRKYTIDVALSYINSGRGFSGSEN